MKIAAKTGKICAVNYCYSAYPMVREMRQMVRTGQTGKVCLVVSNFSHGHHGDATDADNPRVRWRYDPKMAGGKVGRLWTSSVAIGRQHGFEIQVFGETGGMRWASEQPNKVYYTPVGGRTQIMGKGEGGLSDEAARMSRVAIAHPEGFPLAVASIYVDIAASIRGEVRDGLPLAEDGVRSMAAVHQAVASAKADGAWVDARPPMYR